jgi:peptidoglycan hydrolase-like protein with peptidoglycan-binding domain
MRGRTAQALVSAALILCAGVPAPLFAQQAATSSGRSYEGDPGISGQEGQWISGWRTSSAVRARVNELSVTRVESLPIPILFGVARADITPNFGDPRDGGARTHEGLDMLAPRGTPVVSPTDAVVLTTGTGVNSGNNVYTANPGGETFVYMHLDRIANVAAGTVLKTGDLIGYVGNTGNAAGGPTHLHFEVRVNGAATDPYPRLTKEFTLAEKMAITARVLAQSGDAAALARFLADTYAADFAAARAQGLTVPAEVASALAGTMALPSDNDLELGDRGIAVTALQKLLIAADSGSAARALAAAGATGYFGPITQKALAEYQHAAGIAPAAGYYGPLTRAYVAAASPMATTGTSATSSMPAHDLDIGARGADVVWLQTYIITLKIGKAATALAAAGATGYFGPLTRAALAEYQASVGIRPSVGYYGSITRAYLAAHAVASAN